MFLRILICWYSEQDLIYIIRSITPPSLFGIDYGIVYVSRKCHSG